MGKRFQRYFFSGLGVFLPLALTVFLFLWAFNVTDGFFWKFIRPFFPDEFKYYFPGLSILIGLIFITIIGFFITNYLGHRIHAFLESLLLRLPFFKQVYPAFKEMAGFIFSRDKVSFKQVVIIEFPRKDVFIIGFLTNDSPKKACDLIGRPLVNVFVPHVPSPLTGFVVMVPKESVIFTDIPPEEAIKYLVSAGVVSST